MDRHDRQDQRPTSVTSPGSSPSGRRTPRR
jgi:hypothetical protein